jgi:hypothetical protein
MQLHGIGSAISCEDSVTLDYLLRVSGSKIRVCDFSNLFPFITVEGKR